MTPVSVDIFVLVHLQKSPEGTCLLGSTHKTNYVHFPLFSPRLLHGIESLRPFVPYTLIHNYCPFHWYLSLTLPFQQISIPPLEQNLNLCLQLPIYITISATFHSAFTHQSCFTQHSSRPRRHLCTKPLATRATCVTK